MNIYGPSQNFLGLSYKNNTFTSKSLFMLCLTFFLGAPLSIGLSSLHLSKLYKMKLYYFLLQKFIKLSQ